MKIIVYVETVLKRLEQLQNLVNNYNCLKKQLLITATFYCIFRYWPRNDSWRASCDCVNVENLKTKNIKFKSKVCMISLSLATSNPLLCRSSRLPYPASSFK